MVKIVQGISLKERKVTYWISVSVYFGHSVRVCMCVCVYVSVYVCMCVSPVD